MSATTAPLHPPQFSRVCKEPDCFWCGPGRATAAAAADDLADHMDTDHYSGTDKR